MAVLGVNVDHVATLRQARGTVYPDPVTAAKLAIDNNVSCITVHLREDRRHIQESDLYKIRELPGCRLNLEMASSEEIVQIAFKLKPDQVTLVPERREELTTEGGLNVAENVDFFKNLSHRFNDVGIPVSLFIDPKNEQIEAASQTHAVAIEINTGGYSDAETEKEKGKALREIREAVGLARGLGLTVHAGHGLNYKNVMPIAAISGIEELNIGHSIISQAVFVGLDQAILLMKQLIAKSGSMAISAGR